MQFAHLLDKNGNQDKYYVSFKNLKEPSPPTVSKLIVPSFTVEKIECTVKYNKDITHISDLIELANQYSAKEGITYTNVNIHALHRIVPFLKQIDQMVALTTFKQTLVDQIIYYLQPNIDKKDDYKHTIISGPPGTGKTEIAKLLGSIFSNLGVFGDSHSPKFRKVTRSDLVAGYLGQTAIKTNDIVKSSLGGVLFIDEAYSLGNADKKDSYSKECIDSLCELLSVHKNDLMVIIAGYENELDDCFFSYNQGLKSRFAWKFVIDGYTAKELHEMFISKLVATNISYDLPNMVQWFSKRMAHFTSFGRDIDTFISKIKIMYYRRIFCKESTPITMDDINAGYAMMGPSIVIPNNNKLFYYS
jgi:SpoVK/Ycf46/Vps4 family AAA+-type ATPase